MAADVTLRVNVLATLTKAFDLAPAQSDLTYTHERHLTDGSGANQLTNVWHDKRLLANGASEELDLHGPLLDVFGTGMLFAKIKLLVIYSHATNSTVLTIGGAASAQWASWVGAVTDTIKLRPDGLLLLSAPDATAYAAADSTADKLKIANAAGADANYDIIVGGVI